MTADLAVSARDLHKRYGELEVVAHISFDIPRRSCFGFLGPNGAGKTTTMRLLLGLTPADAGSLSVLGLTMPQEAAAVRARAGVVPQADNLDPDFGVAENLQVYASYFGISRNVAATRAQHLLEFVGLAERARAKTDTLSGGMKRRLTIARALVNEPELLILDEPTTGLDPQARHTIWGRLSELKARGVTLILTTHYMEEAERLCDELVVIDHGRILDCGSPRELIARHVEKEVIEVRGWNSAGLPELNGAAARIERHGSSLYCYANRADTVLMALEAIAGISVTHRPAGLEDVFLKLTGRELRDT